MLESTQVEIIFCRFKAVNPEPTTELRYRTPFELLVAVILSAQATDKSVNAATAVLFEKYSTPSALLSLGVEGLLPYLNRLNLYRNKAKYVINTCRDLVELHQGEVPRNRQALEALAGVGRKTANVVLNTAFNEPTVAVDTHIFRVANRTGLAPGKTVEQVEQELLSTVPEPYLRHAHHWLLLHGRYVCQARRPRCGACLIEDVCQYPEKNLAAV